jgi:hypothetical protein
MLNNAAARRYRDCPRSISEHCVKDATDYAKSFMRMGELKEMEAYLGKHHGVPGKVLAPHPSGARPDPAPSTSKVRVHNIGKAVIRSGHPSHTANHSNNASIQVAAIVNHSNTSTQVAAVASAESHTQLSRRKPTRAVLPGLAFVHNQRWAELGATPTTHDSKWWYGLECDPGTFAHRCHTCSSYTVSPGLSIATPLFPHVVCCHSVLHVRVGQCSREATNSTAPPARGGKLPLGGKCA